MPATPAPDPFPGVPDEELVERVRSGDSASFEALMKRHNVRLYRAVRSVLRDEAEIEDVMQEAYTAAYSRLDQFSGMARFSTWLTRIGIHAALDRKERRERLVAADPGPGSDDPAAELPAGDLNPEDRVGAQELSRALEAEIDGLPEIYRSIVMLREVQGLDTAEVAEVLDVTEETVKTRLHRARAMMRKGLVERAQGAAPLEAFLFEATRCERVRKVTMQGLRA